MKNWILLVFAACWLMITGCNKEEVQINPADSVVDSEISSRTPPAMVELCHRKPDGSFELRSVPQQSVQAHLNHGDFVADADNDGYTREDACTGSKDDCDDNNSLIHPGATELCNEVDDNCDGLVDDADPGVVGQTWFFEDADHDGHGSIFDGLKTCWQPEGYVTNISDCDDTDPTIYFGADDIPNDGIDQDCSGADSVSLYCECFSAALLDSILDLSWGWGWWSDVPGCKAPPYQNLYELWITNVGLPNDNFNFSAQAGTINGNPFASSAIFNHETGQFDLLCGGYTTAEIAEPCAQILNNFFDRLRTLHPDWDYCVRFP